jgi:hypothetical protein
MKGDARMTSERIDGILGAEEELMPSSGFLAGVMDRIEEEAAALPPIAFPWKRAIPGMALAAGVFGWGGFELVRYGIPAAGKVAIAAPHPGAGSQWPMEQLGWVALALGLSWLSWAFSRRIVGRSGLM